MKVLIVCSVFPRFQTDSEVPWLRQSVSHLHARNGVEVSVFAPSFKGLRTHTIDGVKVQRFRYFFAPLESLTHDEGAPTKIKKWYYKLITLSYILSGTVQLCRLQRRERFDVLHVHWPFPHGFFAIAAKLFAPARLVFNFHGAGLNLCRRFFFVKPAIVFLLRFADAVVANSSHTKAQIQALQADKEVAVIGYGTTIDAVAQPLSKNSREIIAVGRLIERKGFSYLLQAMPKVIAHYPDVHLNLVGKGPLLAPLQKQVQQLSLQNHVTLTGRISDQQLQKLYQQAALFVLPAIVDSRGDTEGLGVVLIEAISAGCAIVASNVGGIVDVVIHEQTGLLAEQKNPEHLAEQIVRLLSDPKLAQTCRSGASEHARRLYGWQNITDSLLALYLPDKL